MTVRELDALIEKIIGCCFTVHNELGAGFHEKVYENSLLIELREQDIGAKQQVPIAVYYKGHVVGDYFADIEAEGELIVELKAVQNMAKEHEVQVVNYLAATGRDTGLLINFGDSVQVKRKYRTYRART